MSRPRHPKTVQKDFDQLARALLSKASLEILKVQKVTPEQYVAWASERFKKQAFWSGVTIAFLFFFYMLLAVYSGAQTKGLAYWFLGFGFSLFFLLLFLFAALAVRDTVPESNFEDTSPSRFYGIGLFHKTDEKYIKKLKPREWIQIVRFDLKTWKMEQRPHEYSNDRVRRVEQWKASFKSWALRFTFGFALAIIALLWPLWALDPSKESTLNSLGVTGISLLILITYTGMVIGYNGWIFCYGLIGFLKRDITVPGEFDDTRYVQRTAAIWGIVAMGFAVLLAGIFLGVPAVLWIQEWSF